MATDTERLAMLDREAAHTAMCMFEAWLDFDEAGRAAWYPNLCRLRSVAVCAEEQGEQGGLFV